MKKILITVAVILLLFLVVSCAFTDSPIGNTDLSFSDIISNGNTGVDSSEETTASNEDLTNFDFSNFSYVAFGDSITYGELPHAGVQMDDPYVEIVSETLNFASYTNFARGGATFNDATSKPEYRPCMTNTILSYTDKADIISVMLGTNDYTYPLPLGEMGDKTTDSVYGSLYLICEHLKSTNSEAFVFFITPYKCVYGDMVYKEDNALGYCLEDYVNAIKEVAAKYNIPVLDMFNNGGFEREMYNYSSDGVHPSQEFVRENTAPQIAEFIRQNYRGK